MSKILIQSHMQGQSEEIEALCKRFMITTQVSFDKRSTESFLRYEPPQVLIFETKVFDRHSAAFVTQIKDKGFNRPIIVLTEKCQYTQFFKRPENSLVHFVYEPLDEREFLSLIKKLLHNPMVSPQRFQRHKTQQYLEFEILSSGDTYVSMMTNLSLGGAHCECYEDVPIAKGELVRLNVKLDELNNTRTMNAKVVWKSKSRDQKSSKKMGLKFISDAEVYQILLGGI